MEKIEAPTAKRRLPKFKRDIKNISGLELQRRDIEILKLIYDYRFINSDQIRALEEGSGQVIIRRLQKLFHHGYLDRPKQQIVYGIKGSSSMIYALGNKGADILVEELGIDRGKIDWTSKNSEVRDRHIFHTIMISQIRTMITLAAKGNPELEILFWEREGNFNDFTISQKNGKKVRVPIAPDGFFGVKYRESKFYFFVEADRSTMTNKRILQKMQGYWNYWKEGGHTRKLGISNFRILTITKTNARRDNLCQITKKADDRQKGSSLFLFACQSQLDLENPERIFFANFWKTSKEDGLFSLLTPIQKQEAEEEALFKPEGAPEESGTSFEYIQGF